MATKKAIKDRKLLKVSQMPYMKEFLDGVRRILGQPDMKFKSSSVNEAYESITNANDACLISTDGQRIDIDSIIGISSDEIGDCCGTQVEYNLMENSSTEKIRLALLYNEISAKVQEECYLHAFTNIIAGNNYKEAAELEGYTIVEWRNSNSGNRIFMATKVVGNEVDPDDDGVEVDEQEDDD